MSDSLLSCPTCGSQAIVKNGQTRHGKKNYKCNDCPKGYRFAYGRQFVENPQGRRIPEETKVLIDRLLNEENSLSWDCPCSQDF